MLIAEFFVVFFQFVIFHPIFSLSQLKGVIGDLENAEGDLIDSTETRTLDSSDEGNEENQ